jgi:hypothetical protein
VALMREVVGFVRTRRAGAMVLVVAVVALTALTSCTKYGAPLNRPEEGVVMTGAGLSRLLGAVPSHVVGFAWDGNAWHQVPVQVDERDFVNPGQILHRPAASWAKLPGGAPFTTLVYTPPPTLTAGYQSWTTYTPPDSDATFDGNDEVSFLANDTGKRATGVAYPTSVDAASVEEVQVTDLAAGASGYLYLATSNTLTGGSAGTTGVTYTFSLDSGSYLSTYKMGTASLAPNNVAGPNPEHSTIVTPSYTQNYGDRWLNDALSIKAGGAPGTDFLERSRVQFAPGLCVRTEDTFDDTVLASPYEAGFIVNVSGPVRAIRSSVGANSGTYTITTAVFYPDQEVSTTELRVHTIPSVMVFDDFVTGAALAYSDDQNTNVPIDGAPDAITAAHASPWQLVSGNVGSLVTARTLTSDIPGLVLSTYYLDDETPSSAPCTGDAAAWGQSGTRVTGPGGGSIACTDPTIYGNSNCPTVTGRTTAYNLVSTRFRFFRAPNLAPSAAAALNAHAQQPLATSVVN